MNDRELIEYAKYHSQTPRALFSGDQVNRILELAGMEPDEFRGWVSWRYKYAKPVIDAARGNIKAKRGS